MSSMSSLSPASSTTTESCIVEPAPTLVKTSTTTPAIYGVLFCNFLQDYNLIHIEVVFF